jgi:hypothetical protein
VLQVPTFYFHLHNDSDVLDESGKELPDVDAAQAHALTMARFEVAQAAMRDGSITLSHHINVADETGAVLATVHFGDAVQVRP